MSYFPPLPQEYEDAWLCLTVDNHVMAEVIVGLIIVTLLLDETTMQWKRVE